MLGGKVVMHYLQNSPDLQPLLQNARFYRGYGTEAVDKWKDFGAILADLADSDHDRISEAAHRTFRIYQEIFQHTHPENQTER